jgi:hypothetical protein
MPGLLLLLRLLRRHRRVRSPRGRRDGMPGLLLRLLRRRRRVRSRRGRRDGMPGLRLLAQPLPVLRPRRCSARGFPALAEDRRQAYPVCLSMELGSRAPHLEALALASGCTTLTWG